MTTALVLAMAAIVVVRPDESRLYALLGVRRDAGHRRRPTAGAASMSFPALALAAAAVTEIHRYTGIKPPFIHSIDVAVTHRDSLTGQLVYEARARANCFVFGFIETA